VLTKGREGPHLQKANSPGRRELLEGPQPEGALGGLGDRVPLGLGDPRRAATLAAGRVARVSAATALSFIIDLAREEIPQDILATRITSAHARSSATAVALGTLEAVALLIGTLRHLAPALGGFGDGIPSALRAMWLAALAALRVARIAATSAAARARKGVPVHVLATLISLAHAGTAAAPVSAGAHERSSVFILAIYWRQATARGRRLILLSVRPISQK